MSKMQKTLKSAQLTEKSRARSTTGMGSAQDSTRGLAQGQAGKALGGLVLMTALMSMTLIVANFAATKIWNLGGIPVDAGILLFPVSYVLGDLLVELFGRKLADQVAWASCLIGALTVVIMWLAMVLPDYPGADNTAFSVVAEMTGRVFIASIVGFIASQLLNNYVFEKIRERQPSAEKTSGSGFFVRALGSSILAHIPDILLFEPIAFLGRLSFSEFVTQATFAYIASIIVEIILLLFVTKRLARFLTKKLGIQNGKIREQS